MVSYMLSEMVFGVFRWRGYEAVVNKMEMCDILLQIFKKINLNDIIKSTVLLSFWQMEEIDYKASVVFTYGLYD